MKKRQSSNTVFCRLMQFGRDEAPPFKNPRKTHFSFHNKVAERTLKPLNFNSMPMILAIFNSLSMPSPNYCKTMRRLFLFGLLSVFIAPRAGHLNSATLPLTKACRLVINASCRTIKGFMWFAHNAVDFESVRRIFLRNFKRDPQDSNSPFQTISSIRFRKIGMESSDLKNLNEGGLNGSIPPQTNTHITSPIPCTLRPSAAMRGA